MTSKAAAAANIDALFNYLFYDIHSEGLFDLIEEFEEWSVDWEDTSIRLPIVKSNKSSDLYVLTPNGFVNYLDYYKDYKGINAETTYMELELIYELEFYKVKDTKDVRVVHDFYCQYIVNEKESFRRALADAGINAWEAIDEFSNFQVVSESPGYPKVIDSKGNTYSFEEMGEEQKLIRLS